MPPPKRDRRFGDASPVAARSVGRMYAHVPQGLRRIGARLADWDRAEGEDSAAQRGVAAQIARQVDRAAAGDKGYGCAERRGR